jgi:hypothetical protein
MARRPSTAKAKIVATSGSYKEVTCHFNPSEFEITREINWVDNEGTGKDAPEKVFAGGKASDLTLNLLFDSTDSGRDVRDSYETLLKIAQVDKKTENPKTGKGEPPSCQFHWGRFLSFTAVISKISQKFTMFKPSGVPVRATVTVTFSGVEEKRKGQNPSSHSEPRRVWTVLEGQRLDWIAYQEYGDAAHWRHIAETNDLAHPADLRPGQVLKLVPLP